MTEKLPILDSKVLLSLPEISREKGCHGEVFQLCGR